MKYDHTAFASRATANLSAAGAYSGDTSDRIQRFLPMVKRIAWHMHGSGRPGIELEDLIQSGLVALTECAQRHTGPGEDGFAAYAKMRVRGAMVDYIRRIFPLSRGGTERRRQLREKENELRNALGREPTSAELAQALGLNADELANQRIMSEPVWIDSLDEVYSDSNAAFRDDRPDSSSLLEEEELRRELVNAIAGLPPRLQLVVQLYFVEELNLSEIAQVLGVSIPRVHQLKAKALEHLRGELAGLAEIL